MRDDDVATLDTGACDRAKGCLLGQVIGDALGSLVEFRTPQSIRAEHPSGVREITGGGTWRTIPGQPTDDSELALALAHSLCREGRFDLSSVRAAYVVWMESGPFDCGATTRRGLAGWADPTSQANGALMRVSPLGIFGAYLARDVTAAWASADAGITHPVAVCRQASALFACAIASAIREAQSSESVYRAIRSHADALQAESLLLQAIDDAAMAPPADYVHQSGWVLTAFRNALWQLLHAPSFEEALVDTVGRGGDTDTNAAICGALLGAVHGMGAIPPRWVDTVLACRPSANDPAVPLPRPREYWPCDAPELAVSLLAAGARQARAAE